MTGDRPQFPGFPPEAMTFLADLKANNDRAWFAAHRAAYEAAIRQPAEAFVAVLAPELEAQSGWPVTPKIFRIHRDVRFSKDKSPYNPHLHIGFMLGNSVDRPSPACGFYLGLEPDRLHLGAGVFELQGEALDRYRAAAAHEREGGLASLLGQLAREGFDPGPPELKRVPAPYPADHPHGDLLRRKGLTAWRRLTDRGVIESGALMGEVAMSFARLAPLNAWLFDAIGR